MPGGLDVLLGNTPPHKGMEKQHGQDGIISNEICIQERSLEANGEYDLLHGRKVFDGGLPGCRVGAKGEDIV